MNTPSDTPFLDWAASLNQESILASDRVRSNEANTVFRLSFASGDCFLKIGPQVEREYQRLHWLAGRLPAPRPLGLMTYEKDDALLMSAVDGEDLAHLSVSLPSKQIITCLASALKAVHATDITDWPFGGTGRVLVHGDACLPNLLFHDDHFGGCVDVGDMAIGEADIDLAAAVWSLQRNLGPGHGLAFLREYGREDADEALVERLRLRHERQEPYSVTP